ncbi:hypothetical protein ABT093_09995 [Kitasatospora sp. NPDC002551]|uniref:hypothetical protein n=1 Tax=Kitasatospora sp. NPDC002551 TaxID=3154539 RepID=UPI003327DD64
MSTTHTMWSAGGYASTMGFTDGHLFLFPAGLSGDQLAIGRRANVSDAEMLAVADGVLTAVQRWRDTVAESVEQNATVADELVAAKARIAELESAAEDGAL